MDLKYSFLIIILLISLVLSMKISRINNREEATANGDGVIIEAVLKLDITKPTDYDIYLKSLHSDYDLRFKHKLFKDYYVFEKHLPTITTRRLKRSLNQASSLLDSQLANTSFIKWHELQRDLIRVKRSLEMKSNIEFEEEVIYELKDYIQHLKHFRGRDTSDECKNTKLNINDPEWINQWYINDGCSQGHNSNITSAWKMGFTGRNVVVCIIDDGLEINNPELIENYDPNASRDFNDNDFNPQPRYDMSNENKHGTRCAGEIAAKLNNSMCGVGVAFNCKIGGIRLLDGKVTDRLEAEALSYNLNYIDIFSASWGPLDDGKTVDGPGTLARQALLNGAMYGRKGKGTIYVWAAGNGGRFYDNCNCDGYTSSIYTITIGGVKKDGGMPVYSERCSATLASTFTSGNAFDVAIVTSDLHSRCTRHHSGTSASAPIAAGIIALALEANPSLTWRDIQYLIVATSSAVNLVAADWKQNGIGKYFSHNYGFGLINAGKLVDLALKWPLVSKQLTCDVFFLTLDRLYEKKPLGFLSTPEILIKQNEVRVFSMFILNNKEYSRNANGIVNKCSSELSYLEHVVSVVSVSSGERGKIMINLISPSNTTSNLLEIRRFDQSQEGFSSWPFMSVHFWGESLLGLWRLEIINLGEKDLVFKEWYLKLYGVKERQYYL